jgi:hypothetical protein
MAVVRVQTHELERLLISPTTIFVGPIQCFKNHAPRKTQLTMALKGTYIYYSLNFGYLDATSPKSPSRKVQ